MSGAPSAPRIQKRESDQLFIASLSMRPSSATNKIPLFTTTTIVVIYPAALLVLEAIYPASNCAPSGTVRTHAHAGTWHDMYVAWTNG